MSDLRKAAADALEAIDDLVTRRRLTLKEVIRRAEVLRAALAQEAEPAAWITEDGERAITATTKAGMSRDGGAGATSVRPFCVPLYTAPPAAPAALSLTEEQIDAYIADYVLECDDGTHTPTEGERFLLKDAIVGLTAEHAPVAPAVTEKMAEAAVTQWFTGVDRDRTEFNRRMRAAIEAALTAKETR